MQNAFLTVAPIFIVIIVGLVAKRLSFLDENTIKVNNALVFYLFLPSLLILKIANSDIKSMFDHNMIIVLYLSVFTVFIISVLLAKLLKIGKKQRGAIYISSFRGNFAYMGLPVAYYMFGNKGIVISSMLIAFIVPFVNILSIASLSASKQTDYKKIVFDSFFTPIVVASVLGVLFSVYSIQIPSLIERALQILSKPALTLALIGIGASLKFKEMTKRHKEIVLSSILKLLILPFIGVMLLRFLPIENTQAKVLLIMLAAPPATLNYIMACQMGADEALTSANICIATIFSFFSYIFWIYYMKCCM